MLLATLTIYVRNMSSLGLTGLIAAVFACLGFACERASMGGNPLAARLHFWGGVISLRRAHFLVASGVTFGLGFMAAGLNMITRSRKLSDEES